MQISLKAARALRNKTQAQMAEIMGVSIPTISYWEKNKVDLSARQFAKYCEVLEVSRDDIFLPEVLS